MPRCVRHNSSWVSRVTEAILHQEINNLLSPPFDPNLAETKGGDRQIPDVGSYFPEIDPKNFEKGFSILIGGGKRGAVELKNMASILPGLASQRRRTYVELAQAPGDLEQMET